MNSQQAHTSASTAPVTTTATIKYNNLVFNVLMDAVKDVVPDNTYAAYGRVLSTVLAARPHAKAVAHAAADFAKNTLNVGTDFNNIVQAVLEAHTAADGVADAANQPFVPPAVKAAVANFVKELHAAATKTTNLAMAPPATVAAAAVAAKHAQSAEYACYVTYRATIMAHVHAAANAPVFNAVHPAVLNAYYAMVFCVDVLNANTVDASASGGGTRSSRGIVTVNHAKGPAAIADAAAHVRAATDAFINASNGSALHFLAFDKLCSRLHAAAIIVDAAARVRAATDAQTQIQTDTSATYPTGIKPVISVTASTSTAVHRYRPY